MLPDYKHSDWFFKSSAESSITSSGISYVTTIEPAASQESVPASRGGGDR